MRIVKKICEIIIGICFSIVVSIVAMFLMYEFTDFVKNYGKRNNSSQTEISITETEAILETEIILQEDTYQETKNESETELEYETEIIAETEPNIIIYDNGNVYYEDSGFTEYFSDEGIYFFD